MSDEGNSGPGARPTLRRATKLIRAARGNTRFLLVLLGTPLLIVLLYSIRVDQSYVVEARTLGARLTIQGPDVLWRLPKARFCEPLDERNLALAASYDGPGCNPGIFREVALERTEIRIPAGVQILMRADHDGTVLFRRLPGDGSPPVRLTDDESWREGAILVFTPEDWQEVTLLEFSGDLAIGQEAGAGADSYLVEGRYEVRERYLWQFLPGSEPSKVLDGQLYRGDYVTFSGVRLIGFLAPILKDEGPGFDLVVSNGIDAAGSPMSIKSFGSRDVRVSPTWIDRARRDPLLLALTAILGFAVTSLTFALEVRKLGSRTGSRPEP